MLVQTTGGLFEVLEEFSPDKKSHLIASKSTKLLSTCDEVLSITLILLSFEVTSNSFSNKGSTTVLFRMSTYVYICISIMKRTKTNDSCQVGWK